MNLNKDESAIRFSERKIDRIIDLKKRRLLRVRQIKKRLQEKSIALMNVGRNTEFLDRRISSMIEREVELESLLENLLKQVQ